MSKSRSDFIGPDLRATESDLLYAIERRADGARAWLYVLLEHQSTAGRRDRWMRLRLLQYCCRIWERDRRDHPGETEWPASSPRRSSRCWSASRSCAR